MARKPSRAMISLGTANVTKLTDSGLYSRPIRKSLPDRP